MKTICFASIKGGTGKSSLSILAANRTAASGNRVLVIDLDLQNSATFYYLDNPELAERRHVANALRTGDLASNIIPSNYMGVDIIPSSFDLTRIHEVGLDCLRTALDGISDSYDFAFIDTAPTYDNLVLNAINASDFVITPVRFSRFDYKGALFLRDQIGIDTEKAGNWRILFNFYCQDRSTRADSDRKLYEQLFRGAFDDIVLPVTIPETVLVRKAIDKLERITTAVSKSALHGAIGQLVMQCGVTGNAGRF